MTQVKTIGDALTNANPTEMNPYYAEWLARGGGGSNCEYLGWINRQWSSFSRETGMASRPFNGAQFFEWLKSHPS